MGYFNDKQNVIEPINIVGKNPIFETLENQKIIIELLKEINKNIKQD